MHASEITFPSADGKSTVWARIWKGDTKQPRYILQIAHGMKEFIDRYEDFARYICERGGIVCGNDHLGHGRTKNQANVFGYFAEGDGVQIVVDDIHQLTTHMQQQYPDLPIILLGHSMGSMLAREYATQYGKQLTAAIFMGTAGENKQAGLAQGIARLGMCFGGSKKPAKLLTSLAFGSYNKQIHQPRTENDWLTRDTDIVDAYNKHPWNTFLFTNNGFYHMMRLLRGITGQDWADRLPKQLPYLVVSGDMDPVGEYGKGVRQVHGWMQHAGIQQADLKLFAGGRHEILNETNREEVYTCIADWINSILA